MCRSVMGLVQRGGCETLPSCSPGDNVAVDWTPGQRHMLPVCVRMCFVPSTQHLRLKGARGNRYREFGWLQLRDAIARNALAE